MMQEKTDRKLDFLNRRENERQLDTKLRRDEKDAPAENEKSDFFERSFNDKRAEIVDAIELAETVIDTKECAEHFNRIFKEILSLQKYVAASNIFLRTYDIKVYQRGVQELTSKAKDAESRLLPKKKFGFKSKKVHLDVPDAVDSARPNGRSVPIIPLDENYCGFKAESDKSLRLTGPDVLKKDVTLADLSNCTVRILGAPSTLHMSNLTSCTVLSGPVSTSIFADGCVDCTLVIGCQQLRLHSSRRVRIYLHVSSRAIMEDCDGILLAPYNLKYDGIEGDYAAAGLDPAMNHWRCVDDFNWLNVEKRSPHWDVLDEAERVAEWT